MNSWFNKVRISSQAPYDWNHYQFVRNSGIPYGAFDSWWLRFLKWIRFLRS